MMMLESASASAQSVPGRSWNQNSALPASQVNFGSMQMIFDPRFMHSTIQWPNVPSELATTGLLPQTMTYSGTSKRGSS